MSFDVIAQRAEFLSLTLEKQKWVVIANLKPYINEGENFKTIYEYISHSEDISKEYLLEVYEAILRTIYEAQSIEEQENDVNMQYLRDKTLTLREQEEKERQQDRNDVNNILNY